jgi:energy-coupling factor transporter ATP-binding protein EcfA2
LISSIEISNFRGIHEGKLEKLSPLTILVGPNGCGKSAVLDAMLIGSIWDTSVGIVQAVQRHPQVNEGAKWLLWRSGGNGQCEIRIVADDVSRHCRIESPHPTQPGQIPIVCSVSDSAGRSLDKIEIVFQPGNVIGSVATETPSVPSHERMPGARLVECHREHQLLHRLVSAAIESGRFEQVMALLKEVVPELRDIRILTEQAPAGDQPIVHLVYEQRSVPVALSGDGIHSLLRLAVELASQPEGTVLLEEPEVNQHPGAMRQTARAILAAVKRLQVVLTTHSLELIDALLAEAREEDIERLSLYRLELEDGRLIAVRTPGPDVAFCRGEIAQDLR